MSAAAAPWPAGRTGYPRCGPDRTRGPMWAATPPQPSSAPRLPSSGPRSSTRSPAGSRPGRPCRPSPCPHPEIAQPLELVMPVELGPIGIWNWSFGGEREQIREVAAELEELGYGAPWFPNRPDSFELAADLLHATRRVAVATGIVSIWQRPAAQAARARQAITDAHPGRFLLGLGVSHAHLVNPGQPGRYSRPVTWMRDYLDQLDMASRSVPPAGRVLAALGPRMPALARDHPTA